MKAFSGLAEIQKSLKSGSVTHQELVHGYLDRISNSQHFNIYLEVYQKEAMHQAKKLDEKIKAGQKLGKLYGMVVSVKDVICHEGHIVSAGSKMLEDFESQYSATALQKLLDEDVIIIGRVNCDEFAMGSTNENSYFGPVLNPLNQEYIPGGSSGGSAAAIAADTCLISLGSDTGGSVRQPASFCGAIGFKPTYGRISRYGLIAYASSFDQIGIIAHNIEDIELVYEVICGEEGKDSTVLDERKFPKIVLEEKDELKVAYFEEVFDVPDLDPFIRKNCDEFINKLQNHSFIVEPVHFELLEYVVACYYILASAEASSNLSRFDGVRYGHQVHGSEDLKEFYRINRTEGFGEEVKRRIMMGTFVLSSGYYDAYYEKAQKMRKLIVDNINHIFTKYDLILLPSSPLLPWKIGDQSKKLTDIYLADVYTVIANICGLPAISIPLKHNENNLYAGVQMMAPYGMESRLFQAINKIQTWHSI